jgi:hypothetical protein
MNGWVLNQPSDTGFNTPEAGASPANPGDLWGQQDLEWVVIAACGPHQHASFVAGGGNAFDRWRGVFDGLHLFMGYGAVTFDNEEEERHRLRPRRRHPAARLVPRRQGDPAAYQRRGRSERAERLRDGDGPM